MQKKAVGVLGFLLFLTCLALPLTAGQDPAVFIFGGKQLYVGMSKHDAATALSGCCKLSPPAESEVEKQPATSHGGHFILSTEDSSQIIGGIFFSNGKVVRITRPIAADIDSWNEDVVGFARALKRSLPIEASNSETPMYVSVRHERISNAESDIVSLSFPNGRGIELHIGTIDKPNTETNKRDFVTVDEILEPRRMK